MRFRARGGGMPEGFVAARVEPIPGLEGLASLLRETRLADPTSGQVLARQIVAPVILVESPAPKSRKGRRT